MRLAVVTLAVLSVFALATSASARTIVGTSGNDVLRGTRTADTIQGKGGNDRLYGLGGNDRLVGGPGADRLFCGPGKDTAIADARDVVASDCEVVVGLPNVRPTAAFTVTTEKPAIGFAVAFDASKSADPDGSIVSFRWDFGDSTDVVAGAVVMHTYSTGGAFTVTLTVTDNRGAVASFSSPLTVTPLVAPGRYTIVTSAGSGGSFEVTAKGSEIVKFALGYVAPCQPSGRYLGALIQRDNTVVSISSDRTFGLNSAGGSLVTDGGGTFDSTGGVTGTIHIHVSDSGAECDTGTLTFTGHVSG